MPSDSVATFLDLARENRLLPTDQVQELVRRSEVPEANLPALCEALVSRGLLTPFQSKRIREGRGQELTFAGYPVIDEIGPCRGGYAQWAKHPSLRTPIVLRRLQAEWLAPADNLSAYIQRAQQVSTITHPNMAMLLDAGAYEDQLFVVLEPYEGANLDSLVRDIGPMPAFLACAFIRQAAMGLDAAHTTSVAHGDIRPAVLFVNPLVQSSRVKPDGSPLFRPGPTATTKVTEFGLVPHRPPLSEWLATQAEPPHLLAYLPPERATRGDATIAGDVYGLGLSLYYLLTGRPPYHAATAAEMLEKVTHTAPAPLAALRPDLSPELVALIGTMTAKEPAARPTMGVVIDRLAAFLSPTAPIVPLTPAPSPAESNIMGEPPVNLVPARPTEPVQLTPVALPGEWTITPYEGSTGDGEMMFAPAAAPSPSTDGSEFPTAASSAAPVKRRGGMSQEEMRKQRKKMILWGVVLWVVIIPILWVVVLSQNGCFSSNKGGGSGGGTTKPEKNNPRRSITP